MEGVESMRHIDFIQAFLEVNETSLIEKLCFVFRISPDGEEIKRLRWSGFFSEEKIGLNKGTPAQVLEHILNKKWKLNAGDKDFIVMWHRFKYVWQGKQKEIQAYLTSTGDDVVNTAMAKTVGLPLAIAARLLVEGKIKSKGVVIPVVKEIYNPVLAALGEMGIKLVEREY